MNKIQIAVIGLGYWGPQIVRNLAKFKNIEITCFDIDQKILTQCKYNFPRIRVANSFEDILENKNINAIIIATNPSTHFSLTKKSLEKGKNTLVEKPITKNLSELRVLNKIAEKNKLVLMSGHTFLYTPEIQYIKKLISNNKIGEPMYYESTRVNLGIIQKDVNVIWDLAIHDIYIIDYLFKNKIKSIRVDGASYISKSIIESAHIYLKHENNFNSHIFVSWVSPVKIRDILIAGKSKMIQYNDINIVEKIKIYDKSVKIDKNKITPFRPAYRQGDILTPYIKHEEGLYNQINEFINCVNNNRKPLSDGIGSEKIIKILEATDESIKTNKEIKLSS